MTLNEALILSYVKRGIGFGYSILNHVKNNRSDEWVDFSRAGLYKTLDKLESSSFVGKTLEQNGNRPPKKIYSITPAGNKALTDFLENGFNFNFNTKNDLDAYLVTAVAASPDTDFIREKIERRIKAVVNHIETLEKEWPSDKDDYPFIVYALYKRRMENLELEVEWLKWLESMIGDVGGDVLKMTWGEATS